MRIARLLVIGSSVGLPGAALAHTGQGGLTSGLVHPLTGPDHVPAMVAVGLLG